jgi:quaternary ammonium compound-resistance protein SugE
MPWIVLIAAGLVEIVMAIALKYTEGWSKLGPSVVGLAAALGRLFLLTTGTRVPSPS